MMRLLIVDDHPILRQAVRDLLSRSDRALEIVGEASTVREALSVVSACKPDVVMMDMMLPGANGASATRDLRTAWADCRILIYTAVVLPAFAADAFAAGVDGYALKTDGMEELVAAINQVARGDRYVAPSLRGVLGASQRIGQGSRGALLSVREREVFQLIVSGYSNQRLAAELFISVKTVETHRARINKKLGVHSTGELIRFAALNGMLAM
jgi:DNA-binding NarL/FixJ family response regulator